tara:strand:- start:1280 stop:1384 length:105 start_codon:yes stop_codon:yes gene_type:complete
MTKINNLHPKDKTKAPITLGAFLIISTAHLFIKL